MSADEAPESIAMWSHPDLRWKRRDIKTSNLLGQVMAKTSASKRGAYEALMIDDEGNVTEGGASSFFMVKDKVLFARPVDNNILHGITRQTMLSVAEKLGYDVQIRKYTLADAIDADETFITAASNIIPVVKIDDQKISDGVPGNFTLAVRTEYLKTVREGF